MAQPQHGYKPVVFGQLDAFDPESDNVVAYLERVDLFFTANDIGPDKQVSVFLTVVGSRNYALIKSLTAPTLPQEKSYEDLKAVLLAHFRPKPLLIAERFRFYQRNQAAGESVHDFLADLRRLAITCEFEHFLDQALRDRFVCGLRAEGMQKRLLTEPDLNITRALELARSIEAAASETKGFKDPSSIAGTSGKVLNIGGAAAAVVSSGQKSGLSGGSSCHRCGRHDHEGRTCKYRQAKCRLCGKIGHISPVCRRGSTKKTPDYRSGKKSWKTNVVNKDLRVANTDGELAMHALTIGKPSVKPIRVDLEVSDRKLTLDVDTGAAVSILSEKIFQQSFSGVKLKPSSILLKTYTGERMKVLGTLGVKVCYLSQGPFDLELVVVSGDGPCLMGRDWLRVIHLDWSSIAVVSQGASTRAVQAVLDNFQDVFTSGLGTIYPFKATLFVVKDAKPRFHRAQPVPFALKSRVEEALDQLEADSVLEKLLTVIGQHRL